MAKDEGPTDKLRRERQGKSDSAVGSAIGVQLKRIYDQVADEPVPDRFTELLEKLAREESEHPDASPETQDPDHK